MWPEAWRLTLDISPRSRTWPNRSSSVRLRAKDSSETVWGGLLSRAGGGGSSAGPSKT